MCNNNNQTEQYQKNKMMELKNQIKAKSKVKKISKHWVMKKLGDIGYKEDKTIILA